MGDKPETELVHCNECGKETHHKITHTNRTEEWCEPYDPHDPHSPKMDGYTDWETLECQGCKFACLRMKEYFSEWGDFETPPFKYTYYPLRTTTARAKPSWYKNFSNLQNLRGHFILTAYDQIYDLIAEQHHLAAMLTCRALLETIAIEEVGDDKRTFHHKLEALHDKELIKKKDIEFLNETIYDAGNAAMHRGFNPSYEAVTYVFDAIEKLIHSIYIEPLHEKHIKAEKPPRATPQKKGAANA